MTTKTERLCWNVESEIKQNFQDMVKIKHEGKTRNFYKKEIEHAMKLYLTLNGALDYSDDPNVNELLEAAKKTPCTHTHTHHDDEDDDMDFDSNLDDEYLEAKVENAIDRKFDEFARNMKKAIKENIRQGIKAELQNTYSYASTPTKATHMDTYMAEFIKEYGNWDQVSYNELSHLAVQIHGISDKRSIQNRINYLLGKGVITEFSPNVYNVKL